MLIAIGTKNPPKLEAVTRTLLEYPDLFRAYQSEPERLMVFGYDVPTGVSDQPKSLDETMEGARNRACRAMTALDVEQGARCCDLAFGLESGMMPVACMSGGPFELTVCAIYDGSDFRYGLSPAFQIPPPVYRHIEAGANLSEAAMLAGLTDEPSIGTRQGIIGLLTRGRVTRSAYTAMAVHMALANLR